MLFRSTLVCTEEGSACVPLAQTTFPSDLLKLNSFPGLNVLFGDCDLSWLVEAPAVVAEELGDAPAGATAGSFLASGAFKNFKNPGSLASPPVGDCAGDLDAPDENLPCSGMICLSFMTFWLPRRELGLLGLSPDLPPVDLSWWWGWAESDLGKSGSWLLASAWSSA